MHRITVRKYSDGNPFASQLPGNIMSRFHDRSAGKTTRRLNLQLNARVKASALTTLSLASLWLASEQVRAADAVPPAATSAIAPQPNRLAAGGPIQLTIAAADTGAAAAAREAANRGPNCSGALRDQSHITVPVGKSTMLQLPEPIRSRSLGNPAIVQAMLVSPQTLYLLGLETGSTNMIVQGRSGSCSVIDVTVGMDPGGLQSALRDLMPEARNVRVSAAADSLVLSGRVADSVQAQKIVDIANAFVARQSRSPLQAPMQQAVMPGAGGGAMPPQAMLTMSVGGPGMNNLGAGNSGEPLRSARIINMLSIEAPQQVMLEVKVAEVSKSLIDQLGAAANLNGAFGSWNFGLLANFLSGAPDLLSFSKANNLPLKFALDAQRGDGLVKVLAEPNLMAISGQEASFLAGGKVFIPVPQSNINGVATIILQEETFGVGLKFTPTVLENGRINLKVAPEVSELSPTGVSLTAPGTAGTTILPLINTRRASTTLQVFDGQSFAIGGLIKSNVTGSLKAIPGVGELPVLGTLFRSTSFQQDRSELLFVVTPRLVKPLPANYPLPTDTFGTPVPGEVYLNGNMEGRVQPRPAAMPTAPTAPTAPMAPAPTPGPAALPAVPAPGTQPAPLTQLQPATATPVAYTAPAARELASQPAAPAPVPRTMPDAYAALPASTPSSASASTSPPLREEIVADARTTAQ